MGTFIWWKTFHSWVHPPLFKRGLFCPGASHDITHCSWAVPRLRKKVPCTKVIFFMLPWWGHSKKCYSELFCRVCQKAEDIHSSLGGFTFQCLTTSRFFLFAAHLPTSLLLPGDNQAIRGGAARPYLCPNIRETYCDPPKTQDPPLSALSSCPMRTQRQSSCHSTIHYI